MSASDTSDTSDAGDARWQPVEHDPFAGPFTSPARPSDVQATSPSGLFEGGTVAYTAVGHDPFGDPGPEGGAGGPSAAVAPLAGRALPTTDGQRELWLTSQMGDDANCAYIQPFTLRFTGALDLPALSAALQALVARHDALRAVFSDDGQTLLVREALDIPLPVTDLTRLPPHEAERTLAGLRHAHVHTPFDLERGPLLRAHLVRTGTANHELLFALHHLVCDGWSVSLVLSDLSHLYSAFHRAERDERPPAGNLAGFAQERAELGAAEATRASVDWWVRQLEHPPVPLELPADRQRPPRKTYHGDRVDRTLTADVMQPLRRLGSSEGCTLATTILAALAAFLQRLTGQEDMVLGMPRAGQADSGRDDLVGHCLDVLPMRIRVQPDEGFRQLLASVRAWMLDALDHKNVSVSRILQELQLPRDASRMPLMSVLFNYQRHEDELVFDGLGFQYTYDARAFEVFDWQLNTESLRDELMLEMNFNTDLFDRSSIERRLDEFEVFLRALVAQPTEPIARLPLLGASDREILARLNDTSGATATRLPAATGSEASAPPPAARPVHEQVEAEARRAPERIAVQYEGQQLAYGELIDASQALARRLMALGVRPGVLVGVCVERSPRMVVAVLAVLAAGGAYVPLDPSHPAGRLGFVLEDAEVYVLITESALRDRLPHHGAHLVLLDVPEEPEASAPGTVASSPPEGSLPAVDADDLAYVIYTSGSTGRPKGVEIRHAALSNLVASMRQQPGFGRDDVLLAVTTLAFDIAGLELYVPLVSGGRVVIASREAASDGDLLVALLARTSPTVMQATPATWRLLLDAGWAGDRSLSVLCGGEALSPELAATLIGRCAALWNLYGPTETTIWSTVARLEPGGPVTIGRPIAATQVHIVDSRLQPLPVGVPGEICIGGAGLARGYRHRPGLTAERFVHAGWAAEAGSPGGRLYRTGDIGRVRADGRIECFGRLDHQVKIRGYRIELGEIEAVLESHPGVSEAVVVARENPQTGTFLAAYFTASGDPAPERAALREHLARLLPDYMVPPVFSRLDSIPRTPNGKVDRQALPEPRGSRLEVQRLLVDARDDTELRLLTLWRRLLGHPALGITDDFFAAGGHSLLAVRMASDVAASFGIELPLPRLVEMATVEKLALWLREGDKAPSLSELLLLRDGEAHGEAPVFCICGIFLYRDLARSLRPGRAVHAAFLESELEGLQAGAATPDVRRMAADYLALVRTVRPHGPYVFVGASFGGVLAYEMAQQARAAGEPVELVGLLDSPATGRHSAPLWARARFHARQLRAQGPGYLGERLRARREGRAAGEVALQLDPVQARPDGRPAVRSGAMVEAERLRGLRQQLFLEAMRRYDAPPYDGRVVLIRASQPVVGDELLADAVEAWSRLTSGRLLVSTVPGDHLGILRPPAVLELAAALQRALDRPA